MPTMKELISEAVREALVAGIGVSGTVAETNSADIKAAVETPIDPDRGFMRARDECHATTLTASGLIMSGPGRFYGFLCTASDSGTVKFWDNTAGSGGVLIDTMAVVAGTSFIPAAAIRCEVGLYFTKGGTSLTVTALYEVD